MKQWIRLVIDVDYSPRDPGINNWFCERTEYDKSDLHPDMPLRYKDPGGLFGAIRLLEVSDEGVVLEYRSRKYGLKLDSPYGKFDEDGRDYTVFELSIFLVVEGDEDETEDAEESEEESEEEEFDEDDGRWDAYV